MGFWSFLGDIGSSLIGASSTRSANRTNVALQREQQAWEEEMSNTAIQRRMRDVAAAGLNPVMAATGPGASTPSLSPAQVQPEFKADDLKGVVSSAMLLKQTLAQMKANTEKTAQEARATKVDADIKERIGNEKADTELGLLTEQEDAVRQDNARRIIDRRIRLIEEDMTAAQLEQFKKMMPLLEQQIRQQVATDKINLDALTNIASVGGVEASKAMPIIKALIDMYITTRGRK